MKSDSANLDLARRVSTSVGGEAPRRAPAASVREADALPHICFVAMNIYPTLTGGSGGVVGGAEVQQTVLARALVADGYRVSVLTSDHGQPDVVDCNGIRVHRVDAPGRRGIKGLRFIHPHSTDIVRVLRRIDPDIVYFRVAGFQTAAAAWYARRAGKAFVYACAHDEELLEGGKHPPSRRDAMMFHYALRAADGVFVQNVRQQQLLKTRFGKDGVLMPNAYFEADAGYADPDGPVLWVGTVKPTKFPELFIDIARRIPERRFKMVGGGNVQDASGAAYFESMRARAAAVPNLEFVGHVPFRDVGRHFDGAAVFVNTSELEGFPNTFLQAWIRGVPTVSFVRPEVVPGETGTIACTDLDGMIAQLLRLTAERPAWDVASQACREHFVRVHGVESALRNYRDLFAKLNARRTRRR